jgi:hypothetical protein
MPMRLHDFGQWLKAYGVVIEPAGKHWCARKEGCGMYALPAHNGPRTEISNVYLKKACKHFGIDPKKLPI